MTVHRTHPPTRAMRETPDFVQLKRQARELLEAYRAQSPDAIIEVGAHHRTATPETSPCMTRNSCSRDPPGFRACRR